VQRIADTLSGQAGLLVELMTAAITPDLEKAGLSLAVFELLSAVQASGRSASQIAIARRLGISAPSLSEAIRGAVTRGFLTQSVSKEDARVKEISLTPKGKKALTGVLAAVGRVETDLRASADPEQLESAVDLLRRLNGNLARKIQGPAT
jgi:DNA-binding MarR family transcriptional regulator